MKFKPEMLELYAITDRQHLAGRDICEQVEKAINGGATMIQLREKEIGKSELSKIAIKLIPICHKYNIPLIINDNWQAAIEIGADGVHVGLSDEKVAVIREKAPPDFIIGATAKTVSQAQDARSQGADYIGVGAVFPSPTKPNALRITPDQLREISRSVNIPAVAIGGITAENIRQLRGCGCRGIAVISAIFGKSNVEEAASELREKWSRLRQTHTALTIAGSDCSGGAGVQADIKAMLANGVYAMSAITALTVQNSVGISGIHETPPQILAGQIDAVFSDIRPNSVKIGMIPSYTAARVIADRLSCWKADHIILDPVVSATNGGILSNPEAFEAAKELLFPMAELITPNVPEAELISGTKITDETSMYNTSLKIAKKYRCSVLCTGGHLDGELIKNCLVYPDGSSTTFKNRRIFTQNTHGTGCTLSSAIAAFLARGMSLENAVKSAETYVHEAIGSMLELGHGNGPIDHGCRIKI